MTDLLITPLPNTPVTPADAAEYARVREAAIAACVIAPDAMPAELHLFNGVWHVKA